MTAAQAADAGDPFGLQHGERCGEFVDAGEMSAIGADPRHKPGMTVEEERDIAPLHGGSDRFGAIDQRALIALGKPQQHGGDIGGAEGYIDLVLEQNRVVERRCDQIKPLMRALTTHFCSFPGAAQHGAQRSGAPQNRDRNTLRV
jgi:hypothetical protein